jgi:hypothetical protein
MPQRSASYARRAILLGFAVCAWSLGTNSPVNSAPIDAQPQKQTVPPTPPKPPLKRDSRDSLDRRLAAASAGRDCGRVRLDGRNRDEVDSCVKSCFESHEYFHARYDQRGIDSVVARGVVSHSNGLWIFDYDSMGAGEPAQFPGTFAYQCQKPKLISGNRGLKFICVNEYEMW